MLSENPDYGIVLRTVSCLLRALKGTTDPNLSAKNTPPNLNKASCVHKIYTHESRPLQKWFTTPLGVATPG